MRLNQLTTPAEPTPECAERRSFNARVTTKPTLASERYRKANAIATPESAVHCLGNPCVLDFYKQRAVILHIPMA